MGSRGLAHHGTPAVKFSSPSICTLSTMAGKNSNTKYYDCDWWLDDRYQVVAAYKVAGGRTTVNRVCTVATVASSRKVRLEGKRNLQAIIIADSSSKKTFLLTSKKFSGGASKKAGLPITAIAQLAGTKGNCSHFAGKKCCPVFLIQKCNVGIRISVLTFLRSVFCSQAEKVAI
jgi:hypothetical protein